MSIDIQEPVVMCHTYDNNYWAHGHQNKSKFRGALLKRTPWGLEGGEDADTIIHGKVKHGWIIAVAGDVSGCGWDTTMYFQATEPKVVGGWWKECPGITYDGDDEERDAGEVVDGPHPVTWWEP